MAFTRKLIRNFWIAITGQEDEFTTGSLRKAIFLLAIPMVLEMFMESLFAVVDAWYVAKISSDAVAVVGLTESTLSIVYSLAIGLSAAATATVARRIGEGNMKDAGVAAMQAIWMGIFISLAIALVGVFFSKELLMLLGADEPLADMGKGFTSWMLIGNATIVFLFLNNAIFRGAGNAAIAMLMLVISNGLNIVLDPLFIFGWGPIPAYGVEGAAIATNIGRGVAVVTQFIILFRGTTQIRVVWSNVRMHIIRPLTRIAAGGAGQFLISSASWIFLMLIIAHFGSEAVAGYTIGIRVLLFALMPAFGMANAAATLVGQNLGAGKPDRAEKSVWLSGKYNMIFLVLVAVVFFSFAPQIIGIFTQEPTPLLHGINCLRYVSLGYGFYAYGMVVVSSFNGAGDTRTPTILNIFIFWLFQIPLAYTLSILLDWGPKGAFAAIAIAESTLAVISIILFRRGKWKQVKV